MLVANFFPPNAIGIHLVLESLQLILWKLYIITFTSTDLSHLSTQESSQISWSNVCAQIPVYI